MTLALTFNLLPLQLWTLLLIFWYGHYHCMEIPGKYFILIDHMSYTMQVVLLLHARNVEKKNKPLIVKYSTFLIFWHLKTYNGSLTETPISFAAFG